MPTRSGAGHLDVTVSRYTSSHNTNFLYASNVLAERNIPEEIHLGVQLLCAPQDKPVLAQTRHGVHKKLSAAVFPTPRTTLPRYPRPAGGLPAGRLVLLL